MRKILDLLLGKVSDMQKNRLSSIVSRRVGSPVAKQLLTAYGLRLTAIILLTTSYFLLPTSGLYAEDEIYVTKVEKTPVDDGGAVKEMATVELNACIRVKEIQVITVGGRTTLRYPTYVSAKGKEYPQLETLTKQAKDEIEKAVKSGKPSAKSSKQISYKISKFSLYRGESSLKAFCAVDFNNAVRVECKVMKSKKEPFISWPARKPDGGGKWIDQIIVKKKVKEIIEKDLLQRYEKSLTESSGSGSDDDW